MSPVPAERVNDGNWHHVAATLSRHALDEVSNRIYIDGVLCAMLDYGSVGFIGGEDQEVLIGANYPDEPWGDFFEGVIDEVEIFNRALDEAEIRAIYEAGSAGKCKPPDAGPVPTVSEWGVIVLALLLLTGMKIEFRRRRAEPA